MSVELMGKVWRVPFPTATQMLVALKLADHGTDKGTRIWPGRKSLARAARCSEWSVKEIIKALRECGLLILVEMGGNGPKDTNEYRFNMALLDALASERATMAGDFERITIETIQGGENKGEEISPLNSQGGGEGAKGEVHPPAKGEVRPPRTITNHPLETSNSRARACASDGAPARSREVQAAQFVAQTIEPQIRSLAVKVADVQWTSPQGWRSWIVGRLGEEAALEIEAAGVLYVHDRWPRDDTPVPRWAKKPTRSKNAAAGE